MGGQHTSTVFTDRPSRNFSPIRRRVRDLIDPSSCTHVVVKKHYGLHSYLLPLELPSPPPQPVPVPMAPLRLPPIPKSLLNTPDPSTGSKPTSASNEMNTLRMDEGDIRQTAKFVREFVSMSLVPWMEKCVADWNENVMSSSHIPGPIC